MIFKIISPEKQEYAQAKDQLHLLQEYCKEKGEEDFLNIQQLITISEEESKSVMLSNPDYDEDDPEDAKEFSLYDQAVGDDFCIIGSTDWDY